MSSQLCDAAKCGAQGDFLHHREQMEWRGPPRRRSLSFYLWGRKKYPRVYEAAGPGAGCSCGSILHRNLRSRDWSGKIGIDGERACVSDIKKVQGFQTGVAIST